MKSLASLQESFCFHQVCNQPDQAFDIVWLRGPEISLRLGMFSSKSFFPDGSHLRVSLGLASGLELNSMVSFWMLLERQNLVDFHRSVVEIWHPYQRLQDHSIFLLA